MPYKGGNRRPGSCPADLLYRGSVNAELVELLQMEWAVMPGGMSFLRALYASIIHNFRVLLSVALDILLPTLGGDTLIKRQSVFLIFSVQIMKVFNALRTSSVCHSRSLECLGLGQNNGSELS